MKALRLLGIAAAVLLALVAAGVGVLYALFDGEKVKAEAARAMMEQKQRKLAIAGKLELSLWPDVALGVGRVSLSEAGSGDEFLALDSARIAVALMPLLSKQVQVKRVEIDGLKATVVKRKDGTLNIADLAGGKPDKADAPAARGGPAPSPMQLDIAGIRIANAQFAWRDEKAGTSTTLSNLGLATGRIRADSLQHTLEADAVTFSTRGKSGGDAFELKFEAPRLLVSPAKSGGESLSLTANLAGSGRNLAAKLVLSGVEGNAEALRIGKLALDLDATMGAAKVKAQLDSPVAANLAAQTLALEKLAGRVEIASPQMPMKQLTLPLSGSLRADLARQTAALDLSTQFDESKIAARLRAAKLSPPALNVDLEVDQLNVDKYLPPAAAADKAPKEDKLDFSALRGHDISGALRIGALQVSKIKLSKLNAKFNLAGGRLDVAPFGVSLYEGAASGSLTLNANGNALAVRQALTGVSINPLMKDLADKDLIEGRGNVALDVTARGESVAALKKSLAGTASLSLKDGAIKGINLAQALRDAKAKLGAATGKPADAAQNAKAGEKTDFSELTASLKIAGGVARNDDLAMKSPFLRLAGAGDIDIGNGRMDYLAKASVVASAAGQGGQGLDQLKGLTVPVRVSGPFDGLSYKLELGALVADAAKAKVEEKKQEVKAKVEEKARDKLKGLFGK